MKQEIELTILIPVLDEEKTIGTCINKAKKFLEQNKINGEILVIDNGSIDNSVKIAKKQNVRIEQEKEKGYGSALIKGSKLSKSKYTIIGDSDDSYNFLEIKVIFDKLKQGYDLVIGNRYKGKIEKGSMKFTHRYIGTPLISAIARKKFDVQIGDFNCGLRGYNTEKINDIKLECKGMEYATEMIIKAKKHNLKITEVPINFYKDGRQNKSHLRAIRDGLRHMKVIFETEP